MRLLSNWIDEFLRVTEHLPSPEVFRLWGGIAAIAGALERKVWIRTSIGELYPNQYVVLVGPPGVGKSAILSSVENLWRQVTGLHVAPKSVSAASLIDALAEAKRTKTVIGERSLHLEFNSLLVNAGELGVFLPQYENNFMNLLTDIYDGYIYEEKRRGKDLHITIKKPQLNIVAGTTPSYLNHVLPEGAWDQGFLSRTMIIFSGETNLIDLFSDNEENPEERELYSHLRSDLKQIQDMIGPITMAPEAKEAFRKWHMAGGPPVPEHPKLVNYNVRRSAKLLKLCMVSAAARADDRVVQLQDYRVALNWLLQAESIMPEVFKALGSRGDGAMIEEAYHFLYERWMATKQPIAEYRLISFLSEKVPSYSVLRIIEIMEKSGRMVKEINDKGQVGWRPQGRVD